MPRLLVLALAAALRFRVPHVRPGRYAVAIWCRRCGGNLILAGSTGLGQVVTVLP